MNITDARMELQELLAESGELGTATFTVPPGVFAEPQEPTAAGVMYLTVLGDALYLLVTDEGLDGGGFGAELADQLQPGDTLYLINAAGGAYRLTVNGPATHNAGLGFPYTAVPVMVDGFSGSYDPWQDVSVTTLQRGGFLMLGAQVWDHVPEEPQPPCVVLQPADPYLAEDDESTYAEQSMLVTFDALLLVELSESNDNAAANAQLDELIAGTLERIRNPESEWWIVGMDQPQARFTTDWIHHGVAVTLRRRIDMQSTVVL